MVGNKNGLKLRITGPDGSVHEAVSDAESVIVGSGAQAAVKITDPRVSNLHVMLKVETSGAVTAIDLGSEAGTQVGGQRVVGPKTLSPGDVLMLGGSQVEVFYGAHAGAEVNGGSMQGSVLVPASQQAPRAVPPGMKSRTGMAALNTPAPAVRKPRAASPTVEDVAE